MDPEASQHLFDGTIEPSGEWEDISLVESRSRDPTHP